MIVNGMKERLPSLLERRDGPKILGGRDLREGLLRYHTTSWYAYCEVPATSFSMRGSMNIGIVPRGGIFHPPMQYKKLRIILRGCPRKYMTP